MVKRRIVADSSANRMKLDSVSFGAAPLKIITSDKEYVDDDTLDLDEMIDYFNTYKGKSQTSCPNAEDWMNAFGEAEEVFCVAITSGMSGSYNSACLARDLYMEKYPGRKVFVIDTLSAGPEPTLIIEKLEELILEGKSYEEICTAIEKYQKNTGLIFSLESLKNLANNGRVSHAIAKIVGALGIRVVGKASNQGTLEPTDKCRGEKRALIAIINRLRENGLENGRVMIAHCRNENASNILKEMIAAEFPQATVEIERTLGLCSYYAEQGGVLVGYEKY